jgi:pimeloyl-ACP methyl ester carboxylesterase
MPVLELAGTRLSFGTAGGGDGLPALFIQGVNVAGQGWRPQVAELSRHRPVAWFDNRGIGQSTPAGEVTIEVMAADALALLDALGWRRAHLVGHSMGGIIAQEAALQAPGRVASLALLSTFGRGKDAVKLTAFVLGVGLRTRIGTRAMRRRAFLEIVFPPGYLAAVDRDRIAAEIGELFGHDLAAQPPVVMRQMRALAAHDAFGRLPALRTIPALVAGGAEDRLALPKYGRELAAQIGGRYVEFAGAAHGLPIQKAAELNALLAEHFAQAESAAALRE